MIRFKNKPQRHPLLSNLAYRLMLVAAGLFVTYTGVAYLRKGLFSYTNLGYRQTTFSAGAIATGLLLVLLACIPAGDRLYRSITTRRSKGVDRLSHRSRRTRRESRAEQPGPHG